MNKSYEVNHVYIYIYTGQSREGLVNNFYSLGIYSPDNPPPPPLVRRNTITSYLSI